MEQVKQQSPTNSPSTEDHGRASVYLDCFPSRIDFYRMGLLVSRSKPCPASESAESPFTVTFQVSGEDTGLCVVAFETIPATDPEGQSMALELANVLASKFITQLSDVTLSDMRVSPPALLDRASQSYRYLTATLTNAELGHSRKYDYAGKGFDQARIALRLTWLPSLRGGHT